MAKERDRSQRQHERHQVILADMLREEVNKYCADCNSKGPRWASWNLGIFICIRCAGIHRNLGVHISRVKSVNLDSWTEEQIESIRHKGNGYGKEKYEANLPAGYRRPQDDYSAETFIRNKYERKLYISKEPPLTTKQKTEKEPKQETVKSKPKSAATLTVTGKPDKSIARPRNKSPHHVVKPATTQAPPKPVPSTVAPPKAPDHTPSIDLLTNQPLVQAPVDRNDDLIGGMKPATQQQKEVKDSILSLYNAQSGYTPQGYPVGSMYYHQVSAAEMYRQQQLQYQQQMKSQVDDVQRQMAKLRAQPPQQGNSTLNPTLW